MVGLGEADRVGAGLGRVGGQALGAGQGARVERVPQLVVRAAQRATVEHERESGQDEHQEDDEQDERLAALAVACRAHRSTSIWALDDSGMTVPNAMGVMSG